MDNDLIARANDEEKLYREKPGIDCKICKSTAMPFDMVDILKQCERPYYPTKPLLIPVIYHRCQDCGFIFTTFFDQFDESMWRKYIYNSEYITVDPEYADIRPKKNSFFIDSILSVRKKYILGLDYGGGNGLTARILRERGYEYDSYDPYGVSLINNERIGAYNFCSAVEVFEHAPDPLGLMHSLLNMVTNDKLIVLIGTSTSDNEVNDENRLSWWYAAPRNGHISLFSKNSLSVLADHYGLRCHSFSSSVHIFSRNVSDKELSYFWFRGRVSRKMSTIKNKISI